MTTMTAYDVEKISEAIKNAIEADDWAAALKALEDVDDPKGILDDVKKNCEEGSDFLASIWDAAAELETAAAEIVGEGDDQATTEAAWAINQSISHNEIGRVEVAMDEASWVRAIEKLWPFEYGYAASDDGGKVLDVWGYLPHQDDDQIWRVYLPLAETYDVERFITPPENQGQAQEISYGLATDGGGDPIAIIKRRIDRGEGGGVSYEAYKLPDEWWSEDEGECFDPVNGIVILGDFIGPAWVDED